MTTDLERLLVMTSVVAFEGISQLFRSIPWPHNCLELNFFSPKRWWKALLGQPGGQKSNFRCYYFQEQCFVSGIRSLLDPFPGA